MNIADVVAELDAQGIELWREEDRLCFRAPAGVMTEPLKQRLRQHKTDLLAYLPQHSAGLEIARDRAGRYDPFPLTETQQAWFVGRHSAFTWGGVACRGFLDVCFDKPIEPQAIEAAMQQLILRHDMLRAVIEEEGYQRILSAVTPFRLPEHDLRHLSADELRHAVDAMRNSLLAAPSDYGCWPLFAARCIRLERETRLLLSMELIVVDAASLYLIMDELEQILFRPEQLAEVPAIGFRDYVIARRAAKRGQRYRQDRQYWLDRMAVLPEAPALPMATPAGASPFIRRQRLLSVEQYGRLTHLAGDHAITVNILLLGAFSQVVALYAQQRHFTLNLPVFRRDRLHPEINRVVGDFTDVTLLEVDLRSNTPFIDQLQVLSQQLFDDLDHSTYSGIDVMKALSHRGTEPVLMPVVFTSTLGQREQEKNTSTEYRIVQGLTQTPQVLIDCQAIAYADGVLLAWDTRDALFPAQMIEHAFDLFCGFIHQLIEDGDHCLQQVRPLQLPEAYCAVRRNVNRTLHALSPALLHQGILTQGLTRPQAMALCDDQGEMRYGQLIEQAQALAGCLQQSGYQAGQPVAVICGKGRAQAIAPLAVLLCGGCYVPIDNQQPTLRRDAMLRDADIQWVLSDSPLALPPFVTQLRVQDHTRCAAFSPVTCDPQQPAYLIFTSGSTGIPKGVVISHHAAWNTVADINRRFAVGPNDRMLAVANLSFDLSIYDLFGVLAAGGTLIYPEEAHKGDPSHWAALMAQHQITLWNSVPAQLQMLCDVGQPLLHLRLALVSGDWVPQDLPERLRQWGSDARLIALGGATEAAIWSVFCPTDEILRERDHVPYGTPLANQRLHIVDDHLSDRPDWVVGEIAIAGEGLATGYWLDVDKTAARFVLRPTGERLYLTGDRGCYWPDGNIEFLGRADDQVKIRGHRVELGEIAAVMRQHPAVANSTVLLTPQGELAAFAELARGTQPAATSVLAAAQQSALAVEQGMDAPAFSCLMARADQMAMLSMAARLRADGLFATSETQHCLAEIYQATQVATTHQRLLRRWLDGLVSAKALERDAEGRYHHLITADPAQIAQVWHQVEQLEQRTGYGIATLNYIRICSEDLAGLLRGERDVRGLLFPHGELTTAHAAYRDNLVSQGMNAITLAAIRALAQQRHEPLRILEVGAGVAGTASDVVPGLAEFTPRYWFTDLSEFFLSEARKRFTAYPWMHYGIFDMNQPAVPQGLQPHCFDVILCANVLHNARHAGEVLARFAELLAPGGILVFIEPFRRHNYPLLVSMEFFPELTGFTDSRATTDQTFFTREQWLDLLQQAGATLTGCAPRTDSALADSGQGVFIAQFNTDRASLRDTALWTFMRERLPAHMVPTQLQLLEQLPHTHHGKIDRQRLAARLLPDRVKSTNAVGGSALLEGMERDIAAIWSEVLGIAVETRDADFYACGGDSLLLSRMIARLRDNVAPAARFPWGTLLRHLLQTPTVSALAALLQSVPAESTAETEPPSALVTLWGEDHRHEHCCVLLHAGSGDLYPYQPLLAELDTTAFPCGIGIALPSIPAFVALPAPDALARLAGQYAAALVDRAERFTLIGYCLGGLLAAEIAAQLLARGKHVPALVVISAWQPPRVEDESLVDFVFARALGAELSLLGLPAEPALAAAVHHLLALSPAHIPAGAFEHLPQAHHAVRDALTAWGRKPRAERVAALQAASQTQGIYTPAAADDAAFAERYALFCHSMAAVGHHQPTAWMGKTILLRNSACEPLMPGTADDVTAYWQRRCLGEFIVDDTPGDHFSCLSRQHAAALAARIARHTVPGGGK